MGVGMKAQSDHIAGILIYAGEKDCEEGNDEERRVAETLRSADTLFCDPTDATTADGVDTLRHETGVGDAITIGVYLHHFAIRLGVKSLRDTSGETGIKERHLRLRFPLP